MLADNVNKHVLHFLKKNPELSESNTSCSNVELIFEEKKKNQTAM